MKKFDLNVEKVLEDWEIYHAIREVIANALDEQALTNTSEVQIFSENNKWHIRDFGRGLKYEHLTQNECEEKLKNPEKVIGKFGVGLKDAFATFDRKRIKILIKSRYGDITLDKSSKADFDEIITLHAVISEPSEPGMTGTDFIIEGINNRDIELAKSFFLKFSNEMLLEETQYGSVLENRQPVSRIYINGLKVAEEENFLFSYNITSITTQIKKALNRERTNVGRGAYTDRVKSILLKCTDKKVAEYLVDDLKKFESGDLHDELKWTDISAHACKILNSYEKTIFLTPRELLNKHSVIEDSKKEGYKINIIPDNVKSKIKGQTDIKGNKIRDIEEYTREYNESFQFKFIDEDSLSSSERKIFSKKYEIINLIGGKPKSVKEILISETMRKDIINDEEVEGLWEEKNNRIIIKRDQLRNINSFAGTLLHEIAHASSGAGDHSREFESELTQYIGLLCNNIFK
ncbi:hypothetical protein [Methanoplanus limicola]|uniref:MPN635 N-terminal domain-containing protein n=1 Tax=Methanoplanus limicola DSM 2279 TaxID=937775 RepID=H1Z0T6_9EURY|nr:hypothetical protein [Methanoplanus limicola]EHQ36229.1 hypothetical protein Metlim_2156 [Methanoplanus limicola DSM 2279]